MRTTLKRGIGRAASANGNGAAVFPPGTVSAVTRYRQPPSPGRTGLGMLRRILIGTFLALSSFVLAVAGGSYLYFHQSVASVRAHTPDVVRAARSLDIPVAHHAAIALVIGYDHRAGVESNRPSLSDTLMLIRADPQTKTISLLSFPRDLDVPIYCGSSPSDSVGHVVTTDRINSAYSRCGSKGTVLTIKHLTSLPINYLITVNFHGFKEVVDKLHGVWMDVDRRYYNKNTGSAYDNYANIDLQPGYQRLDGQQALDFVRFRHTDSDLYRLARQQEFVRAFKDQVANNFSFTALPSLVNTITHNIEVGEGGRALQGDQVISYALFAQSLPPGHLFQQKIENVQCSLGCTASENDIQSAVDQFANPDVTAPKAANAAALGRKLKQKSPPPSSVSITVLNGSGVQGAAANTSYVLAQRGYVTQTPPNGVSANGPARFHSVIYYDPAQKGSKLAAIALQNLMQPADVAKLPRRPGLLALDPGSMLLVVLGSAFHGSIAPVPMRTSRFISLRSCVTTRRPGPACSSRWPASSSSRSWCRRCSSATRIRTRFPAMCPSGSTGWTVEAGIEPCGSCSTTASTGASRRPTGPERRRSATRASATTSAVASSISITRARTCTWLSCTHTVRPTGSSTRCSTTSRTRPCWRSPRASNP